MKHVVEHIETLNTSTWVLFDIDMVLTQPGLAEFQYPNMQAHKSIVKQIIKGLPPEKYSLFLSLMTFPHEHILVEEQTPALVNRLQSKGYSVMALTANLTGPVGELPSFEKYRLDLLQQLGFNFNASAPYAETITFNEFPPYRGNYPQFMQGALFTNGDSANKGELLVAFIKKTGLNPNHIVFIDDRKENLMDVEAALRDFDPAITCNCILYTGALSYPSRILSEEEFKTAWQKLAEIVLYIDKS